MNGYGWKLFTKFRVIIFVKPKPEGMNASEDIGKSGLHPPRHNHHGLNQASDPILQREHQKWQEDQARNNRSNSDLEIDYGAKNTNPSNPHAFYKRFSANEEE